MTRINLVSPETLSDKHLLAEYRELPRVFKLINTANSKNKNHTDYIIPGEYTLGKGHVIFFYNKAMFLTQRWFSLHTEINNRKFKINIEYVNYVYSLISLLPAWSYTGDQISSNNKSWKPTAAETYLNMFRLSNRFFGLEEMQHIEDKIKGNL